MAELKALIACVRQLHHVHCSRPPAESFLRHPVLEPEREHRLKEVIGRAAPRHLPLPHTIPQPRTRTHTHTHTHTRSHLCCVKGASTKHLDQISSIVANLWLARPWPCEQALPVAFLEFGAGKAHLLRWLREAYGWERPAGAVLGPPWGRTCTSTLHAHHNHTQPQPCTPHRCPSRGPTGRARRTCGGRWRSSGARGGGGKACRSSCDSLSYLCLAMPCLALPSPPLAGSLCRRRATAASEALRRQAPPAAACAPCRIPTVAHRHCRPEAGPHRAAAAWPGPRECAGCASPGGLRQALVRRRNGCVPRPGMRDGFGGHRFPEDARAAWPVIGRACAQTWP